ncbi:MAG TPA: phosphatidate cytidylyltransferase [Candidatus Acidoferrum sp.]|nr:phosphatidate cytidylyltransferase [Candidatus Acidoferrum sp.]
MTWKRVVTAAVLIPLVVGLVLYGSTLVVALATGVVVVLALLEYFALGEAIGWRGHRAWTIFCALVLLFLAWLPSVVRAGDFGGISVPVGLSWLVYRILPRPEEAFFLFVLGMATIVMFTRRPLVETLPAAGISASGLLLVAFPLTYAVRLHGWSVYGPWLLMFALVITWAGDSGAYFAGRAFGRHALAPHLSPKKTWEGSLAGLAASIVVGVLFRRWLHAPVGFLVGMAVVGNVAGQVGDLLESAYKRSAGVKDSGAMLPGHGGMLDRIDALILAIPVVWYYWILGYSPNW